MIAATSSGKSFRALAVYLERGRSGRETDRVAWIESRNLGTDDPEVAAALMRATAAQSVRVEQPVYHLSISFDAHDPVTREQMRQVADRVLDELGLREHQALLVAHRDQEHPHVHLMVNRVHPETGLAWERWQDWPTIERVLREQERVLRLREVPGRLHQLDGQTAPARAPLTNGERRQAERSGEPAFVERVRAHVTEYRAAQSWEALEERLAAHGLHLERRGQGLVITDGEHHVKASRVGRDLSLRRLETHFGTPYPEREPVDHRLSRAAESVSPDVAAITRAIDEYDRRETLARAQSDATNEMYSARARLDHLDRTVQQAETAKQDFAKALTWVYREPEAARTRFYEAVKAHGATVAIERLRTTPERFGELLTVDRKRAWGLLIVADPSEAKARGPAVAMRGEEALKAAQAVMRLVAEYRESIEQRFQAAVAEVYREPTGARAAFEEALRVAGPEAATRTLDERPEVYGALRPMDATRDIATARDQAATLAERARDAMAARAITSAARLRTYVLDTIERASTRTEALTREAAQLPGRTFLEHTIARGIQTLEPHELRQLRQLLTHPQRAILYGIAEQAHEALLGREYDI
jgi:hypothetical protein